MTAFKSCFRLLIVAAGLVAPLVVNAAICQFIPTSGAWDNASNWSNCTGGNGVPVNTPGPADRAEITGKTAILPSGSFSVGDLYLGSATIQGAGIANTTLNVVTAGGIAWGSGSYTFSNLTVSLTGIAVIPAANGPFTVDTSVVQLNSSSTMLIDSLTITGTGAKFKNNGLLIPSSFVTSTAGGEFDNEPGADFSPAGALTVNGSFINKGNLILPTGNTITLGAGAAAQFQQPLGSAGTIIGNGSFNGASQVLTLGGGYVSKSPILIFGSVVNNGAVLEPGLAGQIGTITINGNYVHGAGAGLSIDVSTDGSSIQNDSITISGSASLSGSNLNFFYVDTGFGPYTTTQGDVINFLTAGSLTPGFSGFGAPATGNSTSLNYTATQAQLIVGALLASDVSLSPASMTFPSQPVASMSAAQILTVTNTGSAPLAFNNIFSTNPNFSTNYIPPVAPPVETTPMRAGAAQTIDPDGAVKIDFRSGGSDKVSPLAVNLARSGGKPEPVITRPANPTCGSSLAVGASCDVDVRFTPSAIGPSSGSISVHTNAPASPHSISVSGTGVAAAASDISVTGSTTFPLTAVGATSGVQNITITNTGSANLVIASISHTNPDIFGDTVNGPPPQAAHWCGFGSDSMGFPLPGGPIIIAPAATCQLVLNFRPNTSGTLNGTITIVSNAPSSPTAIVLTGTAAVAPTATLAPDPLNFGNVNVGSTSASLSATFTNPSGTPLTISSINFGPGFNVAGGTCMVSSTIPASGGSCTIAVTATPVAAGSASSSLQVVTSPLSNNPSVIIQVTGVPLPSAPVITSPSTASGSVGTAFSYGIAATNTPTSFNATGLPPGLAVNTTTGLISGTPTTSGTYSVAVSATNGSGTGSLTVTITITPASTPAVQLSQTAVPFGSRTVNTTSAVTTVTLTNNGSANLLISSITGTGGDFAFNTTCPISTPPLFVAASCNFNITFTPLSVNALTGTITIVSNAPGSPHIISMAGNGVAIAVPNLTLSAMTIDLGSQPLGMIGPDRGVLITNTGFATLNLTSVAVTGAGFSRVVPTLSSPSDCGVSLAPGGNCQIAIGFAPSVLGSATGQLTINSNAAGSPHVISLTGIGIALAQASISLPASIDFASQIVNTISTARPLSLGNTGSGVLTVTSIGVSGVNAADFSIAGDCSTVAAGATCALLVTFKPGAIGARNAQIDIVSNAGGVANVVRLTGAGVAVPAPIVALNMTAIGFGNVIYGSMGSPMNVILGNTGGANLAISSIVSTGADFSLTHNCPSALSPSTQCAISVRFSPLALGSRSGVLRVNSNAAGSPHSVNLSGTGCRYFSPAAARFFLTSC